MEPNNRHAKIEAAVSKLVGSPLEPGTIIKAQIFEELLGISRKSHAFSFLISDIRRALYDYGIYLSGEGFSETEAYEIGDPRDNYWQARLAVVRADRDLEGKLTLLVNTKIDGFSDLQKKRHENMARELSMKLNAMRRAVEIEEMFKHKKKSKEIIEIKAETVSEAKP